jgi:hypothetical protein
MIDPFTLRRIARFIDDFRSREGVLPTLKDFEANGFERTLIDSAVRDEKLELLYVALTNGTIVKGYKLKL